MLVDVLRGSIDEEHSVIMASRAARSLAAVLLAGGVVLTAGACSSSAPPASTGIVTAQGQHLGAADFAGLVAQQGTVLIDVRTPAEFAAGHLAGAQNIDIEAADFAQRIAALDKNSTFALYCHSGNRSGVALRDMVGSGFPHVADLQGGITTWQAEGRPVTTS